jgi:hypothetical protein
MMGEIYKHQVVPMVLTIVSTCCRCSETLEHTILTIPTILTSASIIRLYRQGVTGVELKPLDISGYCKDVFEKFNKSFEDFRLRQIAKEIKVKPSLLIKFKFIEEQASKGNAKQYFVKLRKEEVSIDWAHRVLINSIREQTMLKMMAIANDRHFSYQNKDELVDFIASDMQKEGLNLNNEENLDSYLNTKFM